MELKSEYRREAYRNYVIFDNGEDNIPENKKEEAYEISMLLNNQIPYLLNVQITYLNERARYAYDITSNQAIFDWIERRKIKNKDCGHLYSSVFSVIETCSEYLLDEKKLVLLPEYIYYDLGKNSYRFLYHMNYHRDIVQQVNELSEFLMDHLDYEDERAVLLVYAMYHESKRKEASIDTLMTVLQEKKNAKEHQKLEKSQKLDESQKLEKSQKLDVSQKLDENRLFEVRGTIDENNRNKVNTVNDENIESKKAVKQEEKLHDFEHSEKEKKVELTRKQLIKRPIMESRQESEKLVSKYPVQSYSVVVVTLLVMLIVIMYSISQGLELKKLIAVILVVASITAYIGSKMFDPKKKVEKMLPVIEYIKLPEMNSLNQPENIIKSDNNKEYYIKEEAQVKKELNNKDLIYDNNYLDYNDYTSNKDFTNEEDDLYECTQLLSVVTECEVIDDTLENYNSSNSRSFRTQFVLLPEDDKYKQLKVLEFPFYIGKITDGMDAVITESTISRVHAKITKEDVNFYITDMGSTNGTFINDENIQPHSRKEIKIGDILRFANVSYTFTYI